MRAKYTDILRPFEDELSLSSDELEWECADDLLECPNCGEMVQKIYEVSDNHSSVGYFSQKEVCDNCVERTGRRR